MAVAKAKKDEILKSLDAKFSRAQAVYFADFRGLTVKQLGGLRAKLREQGVDYQVAKKTLMKLSMKNANLPEVPKELMQGPVGAAFGYEDVIMPVKLLHEYAKTAENLEILGGLVDGKFVSKSEAKSLALLPSREELYAKLVGSLMSPISGFHGVLHGLLSGFVRVLKAQSDKQGSN